MIAEHPGPKSSNERSEEAFARFVQRYANLVFSVAKRRLGNASLAEDVTQSVFVRISQTPPPTTDEASVVSWLHRVTTNAAIDAWRAESRRREREQLASLMHINTPCHSGGDAELAERLDEALNELRDIDRQAILLRYFRGHTMAEVGRLLGTSEDAAKMRVHRAVDSLRQKLAAGGVACASGVLLSFLMDQAIEAAPAHLTKSLGAIKAVNGWIGRAPATSSPVVFKAAIVALLVGGVFLMVLQQNKTSPSAGGSVAKVSSETGTITKSQPGFQTAGSSVSAIETVELPLTVSVKDSRTQAAIPGAQIRASYNYPGSVNDRQLAVTDQYGSAELLGPQLAYRGRFNLFVTAPNYVPTSFHLKYSPGSHFDAILKPARTVAGTIYDEEGAPVMNASVRLRGPSMDDPLQNPSFHHAEAIATSDAEGGYVLPFLPEDWTTLKIRITKTDYMMTDLDIPITNQNLSHVDLVLKRGLVLAGSVKDEGGRPISGATIRELSNFGNEPPHTESDSAGEFTLRGVWKHYSNRLFEVIVQAEDFGPEIRSIDLNSPTNWAHFKLSRGLHFKGRVLDEAGNPIPGAIVGTDAFPVAEGLDRYRWRTNTDAQGTFHWTSAPSDASTYHVEAFGYVTKQQMPITPDDEMHIIELIRITDQAK